ncbi:MAG TPA: lysophospholipid acyltransferase family protein [Polyangiaceae bacterium]|jgi:KDO2-lipid IV(A) lauroyltransferase|nr:lysophospholipid acyltransferase family protein [Polyangiaceae bacterium]
MSMTTTARDLREGGAWSPLQTLKNDAIWLVASAALFLVGRLSRATLVRGGRALGALVHALAANLRNRARENVARAMPNETRSEVRAIARASFSNLGENLARAWSDRELLPMPEASRAILREALEEGRGVVLPSAHLGPWERLAATLAGSGFPLTAIVRESYDPRFDEVTTASRDRAGFATIARGAPGAATRIVRTLRQGRVLGIPMDLKTRAESVTVPLLGAPARTPVGPARIALRTGAPVVVCTVEPNEEGVLAVTCTRLARRDETPEALTGRINAELSRRILAAPEHWLWMHDRFG